MPSAVRWVSLCVSDFDAGIDLLEGRMGLQRERTGDIASSRLAFWGLDPRAVSGRFVEFSAAGYSVGRVRLMAFDPNPTTYVRRDFGIGATDSPLDIGPKAIDFYVPSPLENAMAVWRDAGLTPRSAPLRHRMGTSLSEELIFNGPDGTPMLVMVGLDHKETSMRPGLPNGPFSEVATISVIAHDTESSREFYERALGMTAVNDTRIPEEFRDGLCDVIGAPIGTEIHAISYAAPGEASGKVLLIHFLGVTQNRLHDRMRPGRIGLSHLTIHHPALDALADRAVSCGGRILSPPRAIDDEPECRRAMLLIGPNEECFEVLEPIF